MNEEKYFRVSDLRKLCDDSRDWGVPTFTLNDLLEHGHWEDGEDWFRLKRCSVCKITAIYDDGGDYLTPYCPYCGAKMDEVEDEC